MKMPWNRSTPRVDPATELHLQREAQEAGKRLAEAMAMERKAAKQRDYFAEALQTTMFRRGA